MANDIMKPNDMLVSTLVNGDVSTMDLLQNGINIGNTQFLDPQSYKDSKLIKDKFTDQEGNFREDLFNQAYITAAKQYEDLANMDTYKKLEDYVEYNQRDIFAPLTSKKASIGYEIEPEKNPLRRSHGVDSLFEYGRQTKSMRELAQMSQIWDSENQQWLNKTADERGILDSLFGQSLVYATYDEDTIEEDPITGRKIKHKKGEWKLNDRGQYYTETIGNRSGYGKQFVAASDTLTKEDSALNKIDFFDSDDIEKSTIGTVMKAVATVAPYFIPTVNTVWGGVTAALNMGKVLPTFAKMAEGLIIGGDKDNETSFTRAMNRWENYFNKFQSSYSDEGMKSNWSGEKILDQVTDIFAQLYQMRAAASISKLAVKDPSIKAAKEFQEKFLPEFIQESMKAGSGINLDNPQQFKEITELALSKLPSVKKAIETQSKVSKHLATAYMGLISAADVYADALEGGFDRRMAGAAGLVAAIGQYGIMNMEDKLNLGGWFLDESVGYSEGASRKTIMEAVKKHYDDIAKSVDELTVASDKTEKAGILQKMFSKIAPSIKSARLGLKDGPQYLKNGLTEALEEMTEEAVMDATKGAFDFLSWAGMGSNPNASFGVADDFKSGNFLERYLQNAVGGFMGGVMFEFQQNKIEPWIKEAIHGKSTQDKITPSLVHEIANGHLQDVMKAIDEMASLDSEIAAIPIELNGQNLAQQAGNSNITRGQLVARVLKDYVRSIDGALMSEGLKLSEEELLQKSIRDYQAVKILEDQGIDKLLVADFTKLSSQIAQLKIAIQEAESREKEENKDKSADEIKKINSENESKASQDVKEFGNRTDWEGQSAAFLKELLKQKQEEAQKFLKGEKAEDYLYKTLVTADSNIREAFGAISKFDYTYIKYGKQYSELTANTGILSQNQIDKEFKEWQESTDITEKFLTFGVDAYKRFEDLVKNSLLEYAKNGYGDVHKIAVNGTKNTDGTPKNNGIYADGNINLNSYIDSEGGFEHLKQLVNSLKDAQKEQQGLGEADLGVIFKQDETLLYSQVREILNNNPQMLKVLETFGINEYDVEQELLTNLKEELERININELNGQTLTKIVNGYVADLLLKNLQQKQFNSLEDLSVFLATNGSLFEQPDTNKTASTNINDYVEFLLKNTSLNTDSVSVGLATSLLQDYLLFEDVIDGEVRKSIAQNALNNISRILARQTGSLRTDISSLAILFNENNPDDDIQFTVSENNLLDLINQIRLNFDKEDTSIDDIISNWIEPLIQNWMQEYNNFEDSGWQQNDWSQLGVEDIKSGKLQKEIVKLIKSKFQEDPIYKLYQQVEYKTVKNSPLYDMLSKIDLVWSEGGGFKLIDVLQNNNARLNEVSKIEDYTAQGEEKLQLESARSALSIMRAVLTGMKDTPIGFGNPFAVNQQMKRFLENNKISSNRTYETIDSQMARLIEFDLDHIDEQLGAFLNISERAYTVNTVMDSRNKKKYNELLLKAINDKASSFTIDDFSLLPPASERDIYGDNEEQTLIYYASTIYKNFHEHFKSPKEKAKALRTLLQQLNLNLNEITRSSRPSALNQELSVINQLDFLTWMVSALSGDTKEFYYRYNEAILQDKENGVVPLFAQELALYQAWSFGMDKANVAGSGDKLLSVHDFVMSEIFAQKKETIASLPSSRIFFVNGIGGAGKTSVVAGGLMKLFPQKLARIMAPNATQIANYKNAVEKYCTEDQKKALTSGSIDNFLATFFESADLKKLQDNISTISKSNSLRSYFDSKPTNSFFTEYNPVDDTGTEWTFARLDTKKLQDIIKNNIDVSTLPEFLFIDEVTQLNPLKLQVLNYLSEQYGIKVFAFGDDVQRGAKVALDTQAINDMFMWKCPKLNISVRADNKQTSKNNYVFNQALEVFSNKNAETPGEKAHTAFREQFLNKHAITVSYYQDDKTFTGLKLVNNLYDSSVKEDIALIRDCNREANQKEGVKKPIMVITNIDQSGKPVEGNNITSLLEDLGIKEDEVKYYSYEDIHSKAVQGSESRYTIVDAGSIVNSTAKEPGEALRAVYTFASRAARGTLMVLPVEDQVNLNIVNQRDRTTQADAIPQLENIKKLKETRQDEIAGDNGIIKGYTPKEASLPGLKKETRNNKEVYVRQDTPKSKKKTSTTEHNTEGQQVTSGDPELKSFTEEEQKVIDTAENADIKNVEPESYTVANNPSSGSTFTSQGFETTKEHTSVQASAGIDHIGVKRNKTNDGFVRDNIGTHLDMDGLFDPSRKKISDHVWRGFIRFKNILNAAFQKEDIDHAREAIRQGILNDEYVSLFLAEAYSELARSNNLNISKDWKTEGFREVYANWFADNIEIDPHYYVFAKKLEWDRDKPSTTKGSKEESVGEDNTVLYYGVRLWSKDDNGNPNYLFNQYISLGTLSKRDYLDSKTGQITRIESKQLQELYDDADEQLKTNKFVAYELLNSDLCSLDMMSTMWIRSTKQLQQNGTYSHPFQDLNEIERRGFNVDTNKLFLIDDSRVTITENGENIDTYKALAVLAIWGETSEDINKYWNGKRHTTLKERIEKLEKAFAPEGHLNIAGSYLATGYFVNPKVNKSSMFRRFVFLNPKLNSAKAVLESLLYDANKTNTNWKTKLELARPASQKDLVIGLLNQGEAFDNVSTLLKYLIGTREYLMEKTLDDAYLTDKQNLLELIREVNAIASNPGSKLDQEQFREMLSKYNFRVLLIPFFNQFVYSSGKNSGNALILRQVKSATYDLDDLTLTLKESRTFADKAIAYVDKDGAKILPDCYSCPVLISSSEQTDIADAFGEQLPDGISLSSDIGMIQVASDVNRSSLGMYDYELQAPSYQMQNTWLDKGSITPHLAELQQVAREADGKDPRFDNSRRGSKDVIEQPDNYEPDQYKPVVLRKDDYIVATWDTHKEFIENHAQVIKKTEKVTDYYDHKQKKRVKYKRPQEKTTYTYTGKIGQRFNNNQFFEIKTVNSMGFEIRPGDYVYLYGDDNQSYYVERIDLSNPDRPQVVITKVGPPTVEKSNISLFEPVDLSGNGDPAYLPVDAVTAIVKRTVTTEESINTDYYHNSANFTQGSKWESNEYGQVIKSQDTFKEMIDAIKTDSTLYIPSLNWNEQFYYIKPITKEDFNDLSKRATAMKDPTGSEAVMDIVQLEDAINRFNNDDSIVGYTLFNVSTKMLSNSDHLDRMKEVIFSGNKDKTMSKYIANIVFKDPDMANAATKQFTPVNVASVPYNPIEIANQLQKPSERLVILPNGRIDVIESSKPLKRVRKLTPGQFQHVWNGKGNDVKFPKKFWMYEVKRDADGDVYYEMYPRVDFYFGTEKVGTGKDAKNVFNAHSKILFDLYKNFCDIGTDAGDTLNIWKQRLKNLNFRDYQWEAWEPLERLKEDESEQETSKNKGKNSDESRQAVAAKRIANQKKLEGRSILKKDLDSARNFVITDLYYDTPEGVALTPEYIQVEYADHQIVRRMSLMSFLAQLGTRLEFMTPDQALDTLPAIQQPVEIQRAEESILEQQSDQPKSEESIPEQQSDQINLSNPVELNDITPDFIAKISQINKVPDQLKLVKILKGIIDNYNYLSSKNPNSTYFQKEKLTIEDAMRIISNLDTSDLSAMMYLANNSKKIQNRQLLYAIAVSQESDVLKNGLLQNHLEGIKRANKDALDECLKQLNVDTTNLILC